MEYISYTDDDKEHLKKELNIKYIDELLTDIPEQIKLKKLLNIANGLTEIELDNFAKELGKSNKVDYEINLQGAGIYNHFIPAVVDNLCSRSEFLTAYTPYQAEMSQGLLRAIFDYQSAIANLTGMEVCNASLYDGATSLVEAVKLVVNATKRKKILVSKNIHPEYIETLETSLAPLNDLKIIYFENTEQLENLCNNEIAGVFISNPNFFGKIEDIQKIGEITHSNGALLVVSVYPISLGVLEKPGKLGADVVIGEGQSLGMPLACGGATLGIFATKKQFIRLMPGRIVGKTTDNSGNIGFVLTMQAREQHIRRDKALSNICSNHAHYALRAIIYLACMGEIGLKKVAKKCMENAYYLNQKLSELDCFEVLDKKGFFNEFVVKLKDGIDFEEFNKKLKEKKIIFGVKLKRHWLVSATEILTKDKIDWLIKEIREIK